MDRFHPRVTGYASTLHTGAQERGQWGKVREGRKCCVVDGLEALFPCGQGADQMLPLPVPSAGRCLACGRVWSDRVPGGAAADVGECCAAEHAVSAPRMQRRSGLCSSSQRALARM
jgi:hypothetical protein